MSNELKQSDYSCCQEPVDPVIPELLKIMHGREPQKVSERTFFNWFSFGSYDVDGSGRYSTTVQGVEFFCLVEKGPEKCTAQ
jgi:hypothetical protein